MSIQGSLECVVKSKSAKVGLGDSKPEVLELIGASAKSKDLKWKQSGHAEVTITFSETEGEQPEVAVVSADTYELEYDDPEAKDDKSKTKVEYLPEGGDWLTLDTAHVYKRRSGVVDISPLCNVKFRVLGKAVPKDKPVAVEVHLSTSEAETSACSKTTLS